MDEFFRELSKHYLGIAAAILIAATIGLFIKEPQIAVRTLFLDLIPYFLFVGMSALFHTFSQKAKKEKNEL